VPVTPYYDEFSFEPRESRRVADIRAVRFILSALLLAGCAAAPKNTPELVGVANFRDVGGYRTEDGHLIRRGLLYRSAQLSGMTPADQEKLIGLGIRYEIDLRTAKERIGQPSHWGQHAPGVLISFRYPEEEQNAQNAVPGPGQGNGKMDVGQAVSFVMSPQVTAVQVSDYLKDATAHLTIDHASEIGAVMRSLAQEDAPALLHCTGGKDRTGITVAVLMTLLGAPREEVYQEYLRSNDQLEVWYRQAKEKAQASGQPYDVSFELFRARSGVDRSWLENAFQTIDRQYQSFDGFTRDALKLSPRDVEQLRAKFLVN
jgi:protein-tyrosine phosphatase